MEFLVAMAVIWGIIWGISALLRPLGDAVSAGTVRSRTDEVDPSASTKRDPNVFRPSVNTGRSPAPIDFQDTKNGTSKVTDLDIADLVDALTGAPLQANAGLFQCQRCRVFYQAPSVEIIRAENAGRCVSCLHAALVSVTGKRGQRGRNVDVNVITLANYRSHVGHVITFEGHVHRVLRSRRGTDFAVMFENQSWTRGFKMVALRGAVKRLGGEEFFYGLAGRTVRVRGLLAHHELFGYQIIISERSMVLSIE